MSNAANISFAVRGLAVCGLTLMAGCVDADRGFSNRDLKRFEAAMIAVDCTVSVENSAVVEQSTGFSEEKLGDITAYLRKKQLISLNEDPAGMTLINEGCP